MAQENNIQDVLLVCKQGPVADDFLGYFFGEVGFKRLVIGENDPIYTLNNHTKPGEVLPEQHHTFGHECDVVHYITRQYPREYGIHVEKLIDMMDHNLGPGMKTPEAVVQKIREDYGYFMADREMYRFYQQWGDDLVTGFPDPFWQILEFCRGAPVYLSRVFTEFNPSELAELTLETVADTVVMEYDGIAVREPGKLKRVDRKVEPSTRSSNRL